MKGGARWEEEEEGEGEEAQGVQKIRQKEQTNVENTFDNVNLDRNRKIYEKDNEGEMIQP